MVGIVGIADVSKAFDLIDHWILLRELASFHIDTVFINWISAFLTGDRKLQGLVTFCLIGGHPGEVSHAQGTKLGVILFAVMTNNLLREWHLRIKFVDDTIRNPAKKRH